MTMTEQQQNAVNFLLFSYFGVTLTKNKEGHTITTDCVINAAINRAYKDASSHVLSVLDDDKITKKDAATKIIEKGIKDILSINTPEEDWHKNICRELVNSYEQCQYKDANRKFTYGIAQKWLNMSLKYVYLLNTIYSMFPCDENKEVFGEYKEKPNEISKYFHAPVDGYILQAIVDSKYISDLEYVKKDATTYKVKKSDQEYSWSKIPDYEMYDEIKKDIEVVSQKANKNPLDWEGSAWIEIAQKRKND